MGNNIKITSNTYNQGGYNLSRTSYDVRQEISAKVIGVLRYNNNIREKLLNRNIGIYPPVNSTETIGRISNLYSYEQNKPFSFGEEGLFNYTHINESDYQKEINQKYDIGDYVNYYNSNFLPNSRFFKWGGKFNDYTEYIDETIGVPRSLTVNFLSNLFKDSKLDHFEKIISSEKEILTTASILQDILQYDNIKYAMEKTRIGTINPNPIAAFSGAVTTNINNFSGTDTTLGLITNYLYAATLNNAAHFNSLRKTKYITPEAYTSIGNNLSTLSVIGSDFRIDDETGRIVADFGKDAGTISYENKTIESYTDEVGEIDASRTIADSKHARYINIVLNNPKYHPFSNSQYKKDSSYEILSTPKSSVTSDFSTKTIHTWNEGTKNSLIDEIITTNGFGVYKGVNIQDKKNDLLSKTDELLKSHSENGIDTLIGRFHTEGGRDINHNQSSLLQTAISNFGMSHGRNLLTKEAYSSKDSQTETINGYDNPYCRAWTYHHQYDNVSNLIRPFGTETYYEDGTKVHNILSIGDLQRSWSVGRTENGANRLQDNSVLGSNGFVNIAPYKATGDDGKDIKKLMFSIENLAWKDVPNNEYNLSKEQRGPNGGRIMWFPPYGLKFNESVNVNWNPVSFIGRGEDIYTYINTKRSGTLSFMLLVDHPSVIDVWKRVSETNEDGKTIKVSGKSGNDEYDEQTLLRFFAGCEVLTFDNIRVEEVEEEEEETVENEIPLTTESDKKEIIYVFFPHNYSANGVGINEAVEYLTSEYEVFPTNSESTNGDGYETDNDTYYFDNIDNDENKKTKECYGFNNKILEVNPGKGFDDATISFSDFNSTENYTNGKKIKNITIQGYSSSQEYYTETNENGVVNIYNSIKDSDKKKNSKDTLSERRALFAKKYIHKFLDIDNDKIEITDTKSVKVDSVDSNNVSGKSAILARCAKITIEYEETATKEEIEEIKRQKKEAKKAAKKEAKRQKKLEKKQRREERRLARKCKKKDPKIDACSDGTEMLESTENITRPHLIRPATANQDVVEEEVTNDFIVRPGKLVSGYTTKEASSFKRWEAESEYFEKLKDNDSFLYSRIVDKIKYFTPAFHSITPEGFNARLSFLHQCTRQGRTYSVSDSENKYKSAGNLAFGLPPICVLRIGDFYYTKIVIESITINYENTQWDMNPEGIGMQPMYAEISLNFNFLGGSDIEAPISRLQNAISFNYYANQSIYDDRADKGQYNGTTAKIQGTPWLPKN